MLGLNSDSQTLVWIEPRQQRLGNCEYCRAVGASLVPSTLLYEGGVEVNALPLRPPRNQISTQKSTGSAGVVVSQAGRLPEHTHKMAENDANIPTRQVNSSFMITLFSTLEITIHAASASSRPPVPINQPSRFTRAFMAGCSWAQIPCYLKALHGTGRHRRKAAEHRFGLRKATPARPSPGDWEPNA